VHALVLAAWLIADAEAAACVGGNLDIDRLLESGRCYVNDTQRPSPDPGALGIEMSPKKLTVRSGRAGRVTITLRNLTMAPLPLYVGLDCVNGFETMLFTRKDTRADLPECGLVRDMGSCNALTMRIRLAPRGVARIHVPVSATKSEISESCRPLSLMPIAAGTYKLVVNTPFTAPVPGSNDNETRQVTGSLTVVDR